MNDIPDEHPVRAFVIETGNLKDGFQKACEHIAQIEEAARDLLNWHDGPLGRGPALDSAKAGLRAALGEAG